MDQDQMESVVFDPVNKCHYHILVPNEPKKEYSDNEDEIIYEEVPVQNITLWSRTETLALINIFSLFKNEFKEFRKKREQWSLISDELSKIGIHKLPEKCEIKWKNLLRVYRQLKTSSKGHRKFEFFNEIDNIVANDPQYRYIAYNAETSTSSSDVLVGNRPNDSREEKAGNRPNDSREEKAGNRPNDSREEMTNGQLPSSKKRKCSCEKSEKQKRHEDRMVLMSKKMEIEERKVKAFEEYLQFLKSTIPNC